jgi:tellurite resistance protein
MNKQQTALIYTMVLVSAADRNMTDAEMRSIGDLVLHLPVFSDLEPEQLISAAEDCAGLLSSDDGLDKVLALIRDSLPSRLRETAYVLACDVAAADDRASQEELRMLEMIRHRLDLDRLAAAAIERAARARHAH